MLCRQQAVNKRSLVQPAVLGYPKQCEEDSAGVGTKLPQRPALVCWNHLRPPLNVDLNPLLIREVVVFPKELPGLLVVVPDFVVLVDGFPGAGFGFAGAVGL